MSSPTRDCFLPKSMSHSLRAVLGAPGFAGPVGTLDWTVGLKPGSRLAVSLASGLRFGPAISFIGRCESFLEGHLEPDPGGDGSGFSQACPALMSPACSAPAAPPDGGSP